MMKQDRLQVDQVYHGDATDLLDRIEPGSVALSVWSPPYFVGKSYEKHLTFEAWKELLRAVISKHFPALKPGGFLAVNIADILCFPDPTIPRIQAENLGGHRLPVTREDVLRVLAEHPDYNRYQVAAALGVSEQTVDRRMKHNNIRGGKYAPQTRVQLVGDIVNRAADDAGLYLYDRRIWAKDPAWENSRWHTNSYRAVDEFEYIYIFWKPGITKVNRNRLSREEWVEWGSRGVWTFASVRANDNHEAKFPLELPRRVIRLLTDPGETVLDCFMGSGTTAVAAIRERRHFIGIELMEKHVRQARRTAAAAKPIRQRLRYDPEGLPPCSTDLNPLTACCGPPAAKA
jgi:site-specific DNA-methyltransferase (adenine-specific)